MAHAGLPAMEPLVPTSPVNAIIFDLDNCLAAAREVGDELFSPAFEAIEKANRGTVSHGALDAAFADCWRCPLDNVAARFGFSPEMLAAGSRVFAHTVVTQPMHGYGDLDVLLELPVQRFLVTSGFRRLQQSKIHALGIADWFTEIHIDGVGEPDRKGKQGLFAHVLRTHRLKPREVLVVGDNPTSEIEAGNRLGIRTVQILRPGVQRGDNAIHHIHSLTELARLLDHCARSSPIAPSHAPPAHPPARPRFPQSQYLRRKTVGAIPTRRLNKAEK